MRHAFALLTALLLASTGELQAVNLIDLRCEYHENPLGIDAAKPQLGWRIVDGDQKSEDVTQKPRGLRQTAYQVLVASTPELLAKDQGDLWDSGMVPSDQSIHIVYAGKPLVPRQPVHWKVRIKDQDGKLSGWSQPATWVMGVKGDWKSPWIAARDVPMKRPLGQRFIPAPDQNRSFVEKKPGLGYHAIIAKTADTEKWVQVDLGRSMPIQRIRIETLDNDGVKGFGFPLRYRIEASDDAGFSDPRMLDDRTGEDVPNPGATWLTVEGQGMSGRYVRMTATKLFSRPKKPEEFCFGLRTMEVISGDKNVASMAPVQALDSVEAHGWGKRSLSEPSVELRREAVLLRRDIELDAKPVRALARVSALGFADFSVNGKKAGLDVTAPAVSDYTRRVFYHVHDVTAHFQAGTNTLGAVLGNGFFGAPSRGWANWVGVGNEPVFSAEVELTMADGSTRLITADNSWKWSTAETTFNDFFKGEHQDLRLAQPGWDAPGFDASKWQPVVQVAAPPGEMQANPGTPVRLAKEVKPVRVEGNRYIFESMQTGWPVVKASGPAGQEVKVGDDNVPKASKNKAEGNPADFRYILKGVGEEILEPRFMVHSIGPVLRVDGIKPPPLDAVTIKSAHADLLHTGRFSCSNPFLNHVHDATLRTHLNYTLDVPMDPTREKAGWTQDVQTMIDSTVYFTDMAALYRRWWTDMHESQLPDGSVGSVAPMIWGGQENIWNDPWWGGMMIYLPYKHYLYYGNKEILETAYKPMADYLEWLAGKVDPKDGLLRWAGASDWIEVGINGWGPPKRTPTYLVSTCALYRFTDMMSEISRTLGKAAEADAYAARAVKIKDNFNARLLNPATGLYAGATDSQTSLILPLAFGMVPDDKKPLVIQRLVDNIRKRGDHLSTGFVGTPYLIATMTDLGLGELLYKVITQQDHPGWNTLIADGVMKETWKGGLVQMPSLGGSIGQWFYKIAGGIRPDPAAPGFKKIIIRPAMVGDVTWVKCEYDSNYGRIVSNWKCDGDKISMEITVPPNTTATVFVPARDESGVTESGKPAANSEGIQFLRMENGSAVYEIVSGTYRFESSMPPSNQAEKQ
jgi:alpha-L-rhamnosidase